jgi:integrase
MLEKRYGMTKVKLRYLSCEKSRHGKATIYVRRPGHPRIRLRVDGLDDPNFLEAYCAGLRGETWQPPTLRPVETTKLATKAVPGSFRAACENYFAFLARDTRLSARTKYTRRLHLENVCKEPTKPGAPYLMGDVSLQKFGRVHVIAVRDRKIATPEAANSVHKALSAFFKWALERQLVAENPAAKVKKIASKTEGFKVWGRSEIDKFVARHPIGTKAYLAMALLFYTGQRRSDVIRLGRQHITDEELHFVQEKNRLRLPKKMIIPVSPQLRLAIDRCPTGDLNFLETQFGKPFTAAGFGNWFRERCDEAGLKGYSAHGLRKALQTIGAEIGLTDRELMAIAGHESSRMTSVYTAKRDRDALSRSGMAKLVEAQFGNKNVAPCSSAAKSATKKDEKF